MDFIKKNVFLISCVAVCLVGIGLHVMGYLGNGKNKGQLEQLEKKIQAVNSLKVVKNGVIDILDKNKNVVQKEYDALIDTVKKSTARELLNPKVFPEPKEVRSSQIYYKKFADAYCEKIAELLGPNMLNGKDRPSAIEEKQYLDKHLSGSSGRGTGMNMGNMGMGMGGGVSAVQGAKSPEESLREELRGKRALEISIYASPESFCVYNYWNNHDGDASVPEEIQKNSWFTLVAYWIQQDVALSIVNMNKGNNVFENPIKRLVEVSFCGQTVTPGASLTPGRTSVASSSARSNAKATERKPGSENTLPCYVIKAGVSAASSRPGRAATIGPEAKPSGIIAVGYTKNTSDDLVDIVQFEIVAVIDASKTFDFLNELESVKDAGKPEQRNQIAVLDFEVSAVDYTEEKAAGYIYGSGALSVVNILCEYRFFKSGYEEYKPKPVKDLLNPPKDDKPTISRSVIKPKKPKKDDDM
ncbi:MAG: hypothetical protein JEZ07_08230 [Phycisphaerae bacterium]|nr:hypothetical protein [Phycisphaerae bacterium]